MALFHEHSHKWIIAVFRYLTQCPGTVSSGVLDQLQLFNTALTAVRGENLYTLFNDFHSYHPLFLPLNHLPKVALAAFSR